MKSQGLDAAAVATPTVGQSLGSGVEEGCTEGRSSTTAAPIEVFAIPGVAPTEAVTTDRRSLLIVHGGKIPAALVQAVATPVPSCASGFALSLVSDRNGQLTPLRAAKWFAVHGGIPAVPRSGWRQVSSAGHEAELASGASTLQAVQGPDKTWQIDSGRPCG